MVFIIDDKCYDFNHPDFKHPGGNIINNFINSDCSLLFEVIHNKKFNHNKYKKYQIGVYNDVLSCQDIEYDDFTKEIIHISNNPKYKNNLMWFIYSNCLLITTFIFEIIYIFTCNLYLSIIIGYLYSRIGLCIQHDANHGVLGIHKWYHNIYKCSIDWIGKSHNIWNKEHYQHHLNTNIFKYDPSIDMNHILYLNKWDDYKWFNYYQNYYIWFLLLFYGFIEVFNFKNLTVFALFMRCLFFCKLLVFPFLISHNIFKVVVGFIIITIVSGFILSLLFIVSHLFENTTFYNHIVSTNLNSYYKHQIECSSSYGNWLDGILTGGLNYQIEHHLFSTICSIHYPEIQKDVIKLCYKYNLKYNYYSSFIDNLKSTYKFLENSPS